MSDQLSDGLVVVEESLRRLANTVREMREQTDGEPISEETRSPGELLMLARNRAGLSQKELAERAGVSANTIIGFENGHSSPRVRTLMALAEEVGLPWEVLKEDADAT